MISSVPVSFINLLHQYLQNELDCSRDEMSDNCVLAQLYDEFYRLFPRWQYDEKVFHVASNTKKLIG